MKEEVIEEEEVLVESFDEEPISTVSAPSTVNPPGLVAYPQLVQGISFF